MQRFCEICGAHAVGDEPTIEHTPHCPNNRDAIDDTPVEPVASNVTSFTLARADRGSKPREHKVADALDLAREWMRLCGPENQPDHIIVFLGRTNGDNSSGTKYFQTGSFSPHAQVGLVHEALDLLRNGGK